MKTINRVLFTAIVGIWILLSDPIARSQSVSQNPIPHSTKQDSSDSGSPHPQKPGTSPSNTDDEWPGNSQPGGGTSVRGRDGFCSIAPATSGQAPATIWHDRPLFLWEGNVSRIEVISADTDTVVWSGEPAAGASSLQYDGAPLQPGQTYDVIITASGQLILSFTVMDAQMRDEIAAELNALEERFQGADARDLAFARAQYFAQRGLRSDALQEAFSAIEPGEDAIAIGALLTCDLQN